MTRVTEVETVAVGDMLKLFTVKFVANVNGYRNVLVDWFVNRSFNDEEFRSGLP